MNRLAALLLLLGTAGIASARGDAADKLPACDPSPPQLYIAPMGQPFRAAAGQPDPAAAWFAKADADHDGRLTISEFAADAAAFFGRLDTDRSGAIEPPEIEAYETEIAPEIRLYQRPSQRWIEGRLSKAERKAATQYGGALGAGRWSQLNVPEPVVAADLDFNGAVDADEFRGVAAQRFAQLRPGADGALRLADLAPTPAQREAADCAATALKQRRR